MVSCWLNFAAMAQSKLWSHVVERRMCGSKPEVQTPEPE